MKTLFLAETELTLYRYMQDSEQKTVTRLVWGENENDASEQIKAYFDANEFGDADVIINWTILREAIGSPI